MTDEREAQAKPAQAEQGAEKSQVPRPVGAWSYGKIKPSTFESIATWIILNEEGFPIAHTFEDEPTNARLICLAPLIPEMVALLTWFIQAGMPMLSDYIPAPAYGGWVEKDRETRHILAKIKEVQNG